MSLPSDIIVAIFRIVFEVIADTEDQQVDLQKKKFYLKSS